MDVFSTVAGAGRGFLRDAALHAACELGLFAALCEPRTVEALARALGLDGPRLRALTDVLVLEGLLERRADRLAATTTPTRPAPPPRQGWGRIAEVVRAGRPLDEPLDPVAFHKHLFAAGAGAARELAARFAPALAAGTLLDAGGGAGVYTAALLEAAPAARATLVDRAEIVALAHGALAAQAPRVRFVAGDLLAPSTALGDGYALGLLANVLHLHPPAQCAALVARIAAAVAPGGVVVVKEVLVEPDRSGPAVGLLFALNMALYTEGGDTYDPNRIAGWLRAAGLEDARIEPLAASPDAVMVSARRPITDPRSVISRTGGKITDPGSVIPTSSDAITDPGSVIGRGAGEGSGGAVENK